MLSKAHLTSHSRMSGSRPQTTSTRHDPDDHDGVITHLEPDILECEVKWALESITINKASGGDGIPVELFQVLIDDAVKVLLSSAKTRGFHTQLDEGPETP